MFASDQVAVLLTGQGEAMDALRQQAREHLSNLAEELAQEFSLNLSEKVQSKLLALQSQLGDLGEEGIGGSDVSVASSGGGLETMFSSTLSSLFNSVGSSFVRGKKPSTKTVLNAVARSLGQNVAFMAKAGSSHTQLRLSRAQQGSELASMLAGAQKNQ